MTRQLDRELLELLVETNEQRRRFGQTLYHFYRTLVFWMPKGRTFFQITQAWSAAAATIFDNMAATLERLEGHQPDPTLRAFVARVLDQLADDLERGDNMLVPFLRWLETLFPALTEMIRQESVGSRLYDWELARELANLFARIATDSRSGAVARLRASAEGLRPSEA